ncbi:MAG: ArnT family glycosyltransferase [Terriglobales bacterium]
MAAGAQPDPVRRASWGLRLAPLGIYVALLALHAPLLRLPYFWDEAGYFIVAARDCWRHFWLIPHATLANGHPPLLSLYLSAVWMLTGFHILATRAAMLVWAAALVWAVYRLAEARLGRQAWIPALLVALSPLVFAQSSLAQLDLPVAALVLWALVGRQRGRPAWETGLLAAACLMKETAIIVPAVLLLYDRRRGLRHLVPIGALGLWFVFYHAHTGYWFGNPQYYAYNVGLALGSLPRVLLDLLRRIWQVGFYDGTGALTAVALWALWACRRRQSDDRPGPRWPTSWLLVIAVYIVFHAVVGGAVLARYLLPALALYIIGVSELLVRLPRAAWWATACAAILVASWFWNPPYPFPYEDNLAYVHFIRLHQAAARELEAHPPAGAIWTAWPATDELTRPALGYVGHRLPIHALQNFSAASLDQVTEAPPVLYLYSRIYQPRMDLAKDSSLWARWSLHYFGYSGPAPPVAWLRRLHLHPLYRRASHGQWVLLAAP